MKNRTLLFYILVFVFLSICIGYLTQFTGLNHDFSDVITYMRLAYLGIEILIILKILHLIIKTEAKELIKKIAISSIALLSLIIILEGVFMFVPRSHGGGGQESLAARLWFSKYWEVNGLGYRDAEVKPEQDKNKFNIMVIGDSFVAGHGIKDPTKRFSNLLQNKLSTSYKVHNLGLNGADTQAEYSKLVQFPIKPSLIILVHHPNDIERVPRPQTSIGDTRKKMKMLKASLLAFSIHESLFKNSYLLNYFFWKFYPVTSLDSDVDTAGKEYFASKAGQSSHLSAYLNEDIFKQHLQNLHQFVLLSREESIPLIVILFPETWDETIEFSKTYTNQPITAFFTRQNVSVLDLYETLSQLPVRDRIVNNNDAHPSELTHQKVAELLYNYLKTSKFID
ncbi:MAG: hypothetical protein COB85_01400 [Bacteroidetes bacterium]|nr:MAG: hypothetical protein COB85_01400 [Bacteroidota bacterium]